LNESKSDAAVKSKISSKMEDDRLSKRWQNLEKYIEKKKKKKEKE